MAIDEARTAEIKEKLQQRDTHIRESWVKAMEARLVREELEKCQKGEGVNHYENCRWLADKYIQMLRDNRVQGYKHIEI
ncbi:NADH-ubiquinone oxidoreductase 12 kDa subunit [Crucibulum laeve]|uniref:NADH-ubiquinone oxidoreductase 12 kDa subunit n=1 Tax=Crucibulum laeve TaxID=68775 RepID=A0A5C3M773_9AGAR|nr:NADH-ubiquinone oxidoreductase 12 kDa subunit [Crucibulum laeve]